MRAFAVGPQIDRHMLDPTGARQTRDRTLTDFRGRGHILPGTSKNLNENFVNRAIGLEGLFDPGAAVYNF